MFHFNRKSIVWPFIAIVAAIVLSIGSALSAFAL